MLNSSIKQSSVIIISETFDSITDNVCRWLLHFKQPFVRLNYNDSKVVVSDILYNLNQESLSLSICGEPLCFDFVKSVWFRRGSFYNLSNTVIDECDNEEIKFFLRREYDTAVSCFHDIIRRKCFVLGNPEKSVLNKIIVLNIARRIGFAVPKSVITADATVVKSIFEKSFLSKAINDLLEVEYNGMVYQQRIKYFNSIEDLPDVFSLSLFQEVINYVAEIRVFYLLGSCFSVANYSIDKESIWAKIHLPKSICKKIIRLMNELDLNTGSIDLLLTRDGDYFFLEVNPVGQFGFVRDWGF